MVPSPDSNSCPRCGAPLATDSAACPACLLRQAFPTPPTESARDEAPTLEELAPHFPQLELEALIGRGAMGAVYRARQRSLGRTVALKVLARELWVREGFTERFEREARALAALQHPGIVSVHDAGVAGPFPYLVMEYVDGASLREVLRDGALAADEVLGLVTQLCAALDYAHARGVVHRDIKPENVLLDREGRLKIADFGLAKLADSRAEGLTRATQAMGTPPYMAPEQYERPTQVDHRADLYALGVMLYELLTGELPLGRFDAPSKRAAVDVRLDAIVLKALERDRDRRYQRASELETDLNGPAPSSAATAPAASSASVQERPRSEERRHQEQDAQSTLLSMFAVLAFAAASMIFRYLPLSNVLAKGAWTVTLAVAIPLLLARPFTLRGTVRGTMYGFSLCAMLATLMANLAFEPERLLEPLYGAWGDQPGRADAWFVRVSAALVAAIAGWGALRLLREAPARSGFDRLMDVLIVVVALTSVMRLGRHEPLTREWYYDVSDLVFHCALWAEAVASRREMTSRDRRGVIEIGSAPYGASAALELVAAGERKLEVIAALRKATGATLSEAKYVVDHAPKWVALRLAPDDAEDLGRRLQAAGATVRVERPGPVNPPRQRAQRDAASNSPKRG